MNNSYNKQPAIHIEIPTIATLPTEKSDGFCELREWQTKCFKKLVGSRNWMIIAPPAAGKSVEICAIAADRLKRDDDLKVIIAVPQTIIAAGFRANRIVLPDGTRIEWTIPSGHDLCRERPQQSAAHLVAFLSAPNSQDPMSRVLLCTHSTLVRAFAKDKSAFQNILLVIDEAHHSRHGEYDDSNIEVDNQLGALVRYCLLHSDEIQLGLTTATFFRGDQATIIPDVSQFTRFEFPYDEYLATCKHLHSFSYEFLTHSASFIEPLAHLFAQTTGKTIVYIPPVGTSCSLGTKAQDVDAVLKAIAGADAYVVDDQDQPIMRLKRGNEWVKVVNLVDEHLREEKKEVIIAAHEKPDSSDIDVIIALGLFKEGANWRWADREIIIGQRGSLTELSQMIGRLLRDAPGKRHVEVVQLLPFVFDQTDKTQMRRSLNDYFTAILLSMLIESVISPLPPVGTQKSTPGDGEHRVNYLREAFSDDSQAAMVLEEIRQQVCEAFAMCGSLVEGRSRREVLRKIVTDVLTAHGVSDYHDEIADQVFQMINRRSATLKRLNVGNVDMDLISENPFGCFLQYASETCGIRTFQELRAASRVYAMQPFAAARAFIRSLKLNSQEDWYTYCVSGKKPDDIPRNPNIFYRGQGWVGFGDWLGTERRANADRVFRSFSEARAFVRTLDLNSQDEWRAYCASGKRPEDIPGNPNVVYHDEGWAGYGDWLGTGKVSNRKRVFRPFAEARAFVWNLGLKSQKAWRTFCKSGDKPQDIPGNPNSTYAEAGWDGYGDWLGTGKIATSRRQFRPFLEARHFVHTLQFKSIEEWRRYCKSGEKPKDIPSAPAVTYKHDGWINISDWLGKGEFRSFECARECVHSLELGSKAEWLKYCTSGEKPSDIPSDPAGVYKDHGWISIGDWLGTGRIDNRKRVFRSFDLARKYARHLRLKSQSEWKQYCNTGERPADIPSNPNLAYKFTGWTGWGDWLGTDLEASCKAADGPELRPRLEWGTTGAALL
jgi:superfamily II DNA or RNA helicase/predicted small metal-binding protein